MFRSVLVPLDGSPLSEQVLPLAEMVGRAPNTRLHLVSVEDHDAGAADRQTYLIDIEKRLQLADIEVDHTILEGKVVAAIEERARQVDADLIVMATHGRSGLERLRFGSVAEGLVNCGIAPMLLFHPRADVASPVPKSIDHVVVAVDESAHSQDILDPLARLGKAVGVSRYTLVHVADGKGAGKAGWEPLSTLQTRAEERLGPLREWLGCSDVDVKVILGSNPSDGILSVAQEIGADLIAMTTHGMTGVRPTLFGSVAAQVLHKWNGALLVQRASPT
jgi:nucleotide-binding universal stress UspA family protein